MLVFTAAADENKAADEAKKTSTERRLESLLDPITQSPPSLLLGAPASGESHHGNRDAASSPAVASPASARQASGESGVGDGSDNYEQGKGAGSPGDGSNDILPDDKKAGARGTRCA